MRQTPVVTAIGAMTSLGGANECWDNICQGKSGIKRTERWKNIMPHVKTSALLPELPPLASVGGTLGDWCKKEKIERHSDRSVQIALHALGDLINNFPGIFENIKDKSRFGIVCGPCLGGQSRNEEGYSLFLNGNFGRSHLYRVVQVMIDAFSGLASQILGAKGYSSCCLTACATGLSNILAAAEKIESGRADIMLAGGFEGVTDYLAVAFNGAGTLSVCYEIDKASRPFCLNRDGFVIGEGAGLVVLESLEHALNRGVKPLAVLKGWEQTCGASHMTDADPEMQTETIAAAILDAHLLAKDIDVISCHGTSTKKGDENEGRAIGRNFQDENVTMLATKANLGHTLGAAGALEFIQCVQALQNGIVPRFLPNSTLDPQCLKDCMHFPKETYQANPKTALTVNFGFGDKNAAAVIQAYEP